MIINRKVLVLITFLAGLFLSCSKTSSVATGGTETGDAVVVMGRVVDSEGNTAAGASVRIIKPDEYGEMDTSEVPSALTDPKGFYLFRQDDMPDDYIGSFLNIVIKGEGEVSFIDSVMIIQDSTIDLQTDTVSRGASVSGWFDEVEDSVRNVKVYIKKLGEFADINMSGNSFSFVNIPAGQYSLIFNSTGVRNYTPDTVSVSVLPGEEFIVSDTVSLLSEVSLEDFNDGDIYTDIRNIVPESYWFAYNSVTSGNLASVDPPELTSDFTQALTSSGSYEGMSLNYSVVFDLSAEAPAVGAGCFISQPGSYADFSAFDSLSFFCKGSNRMRVSIHTEAVSSYPDGQDWGHFGMMVDCPQEWQRVVVKPEDLIPEPGSPQEADNLQWSDGKAAVDRIVFGVNETYGTTIDVWIDDICVYGLKKSDFE